MKLHQIDGISIDPGAPIPKVISSETELYLLFYAGDEVEPVSSDIESRDVLDTGIVAVARFGICLTSKFGYPGSEALSGHPYYQHGLKYYSGFWVENSDWIEDLKKIDRVHPYHSPSKFKKFKHYVFTFHDTMFECIAQEFEIKYETRPLFELAELALNELVRKEI